MDMDNMDMDNMEILNFDNIDLNSIDNKIKLNYIGKLKEEIKGNLKIIEENAFKEVDIIEKYIKQQKEYLLKIVKLNEEYKNNINKTYNYIKQNNIYNYLNDINLYIIPDILNNYFENILYEVYQRIFLRIEKEYFNIIYNYIGGENKKNDYGLEIILKEYLSIEQYNNFEKEIKEMKEYPGGENFQERINSFFESLNKIIKKDVIKDFIKGIQEKAKIEDILEKEKKKGIEKIHQFIIISEIREKTNKDKEICLVTNSFSYYDKNFSDIKSNIKYINENMSKFLLISMFINNPDNDELLYKINNSSSFIDISRNWGKISGELSRIFSDNEIKRKVVTFTWENTILNKKTILLEDFTIKELLSLVDEDSKLLKKIITKITINVNYKDYDYYSTIKIYFKINNIEDKINKIEDLIFNNK